MPRRRLPVMFHQWSSNLSGGNSQLQTSEHLGAELAQVSKTVFRGGPSRPGRLAGANVALHRALITVGTTGDRLALARDTLLGIGGSLRSC